MLKYTGELYGKIGRKYINTGKTGADWDALALSNEALRGALEAYQNCAGTEPHMEGGYTITGWTPTKLNKAYETARNVLNQTK
jgi:hypothetical protein